MKIVTWTKRASFLIVATLFLTLVADWLFYDEPLGWTLGAYALLITGCVLIRFKPEERKGAVRCLELLICGLAGSLIIEPGPIAVTLTVFLIISLAVIYRNGWTNEVAIWFEYWAAFIPQASTRMSRDCHLLRRLLKRAGLLSLIRTDFIRNWGLPICFGFVFVIFFSQANPIIDHLIVEVLLNLRDSFLHAIEEISFLRTFFWIVVATGIWVLFRVRVRSMRKKTVIPKGFTSTITELPISLSFIVRCLIVFNLVFAGQTLLDLTYLFAGVTLPEGFTYAEYAHRGSYPLVATALLAGIFVLFTFRSGGTAESSFLARRLVYAWIAQNIFLMYTASWRLMLYVRVYHLTRFRIAAVIWMLLVAIGFVCIIIRILRQQSNAWLLRATFVGAVTVLYCCAFINFDGHIAWYNVKHSAEITGKGATVDLRYLKDLGPESIPALEWLSQQIPSEAAGQKALAQKLKMESKLTQKLSNWRAWSVLRLSLQKTQPKIAFMSWKGIPE